MNRIDIPMDRGLIIINIFIVKDVIIKIRERVIYNNEGCTHSSNIKGLCALYTILYLSSSSVDAHV